MIEPGPVPAMKKGTLGSPFFRSSPDRRGELCGLGYFLASDATGANPDPLRSTVDHDADGLKIGHPATLPPIVGVAHMVAGRGTLGADGANACHSDNSPLVVLVVEQARKCNWESEMAQGILCRER